MTAVTLAAQQVLASYPTPLRVGAVRLLGNRGGFSGASLFYLDNPAGALCLRAWPTQESEPHRLAWLHRLMNTARDAGLSFVPRVFPARDGRTFVQHVDRCWELQEWMPGRPDFHEQPTAARLENACIALARLHEQWSHAHATAGPCPAIQRRLDGIRQWHTFAASITGGSAVHDPSLRGITERAERVLDSWLRQLTPWLELWATRSVRLHPCLCDVWHDHVFFQGDQVTGIIDYGAVKVDHPAVDLARMLGSLIEDDETACQTGLAAYRTARPFSTDEERLARVLDVSGTVLGIANWLRWLAGKEKDVPDLIAAGQRLETLVRRVERWKN